MDSDPSAADGSSTSATAGNVDGALASLIDRARRDASAVPRHSADRRSWTVAPPATPTRYSPSTASPASTGTPALPYQPLSASTSPVPYPLLSGPGQPWAAMVPAKRKRSKFLIFLLLLLTLAVIAQGGALFEVNKRLVAARASQRSADRASSAKINDLQSRAGRLESAQKAAMNPEAVAADVLPSVFQVDAGDFIGTSFAIGHPTGGGTYLITNFHVVSQVYGDGKRTVDIDHKGQRFGAAIKRVDKAKDLALLFVAKESLPILTTTHTAVVGEEIVALGEPLGLEDTVTTGVISNVNRTFADEPGITYLQFDAAVNPGNSGGPLVDANREVVGVVTAKLSDAEGLALALPISDACDAFDVC
ncbi:MAG TPA: trypsin-like peptidase domain-containing protein [Micromonosporaceae bacterium]|jgi:hypothetical protein